MNLHFPTPSGIVLRNREIDAQLIDAVAAALATGAPPRSPAKHGGLAPWQAKRVARHIVDHAAAGIQIGDLAALARLSTSHFSRAFRMSFGMSPYAMVCRYRIGEAMRLMLSTDWPLAEIAGTCGFADQSHFTRLFHRHTDTSPGKWRRSHRIHEETSHA
jgi:AraC-like DNA-binding protein